MPLLIEIMVTHKCTEDKIRNGMHIIEIHQKNNITLYNFNEIGLLAPSEALMSMRTTDVLAK